jgi:hypothetical protein
MDARRTKDLNSVPLPTVLLLPAAPCALRSVGQRSNSGRCRLLHSAGALLEGKGGQKEQRECVSGGGREVAAHSVGMLRPGC